VRIYFCSDIHASRKCWKKFLNSWKFYGADHIVVGGDITGKFVVPIVEAGGGRYTTTFLGIERKVSGPEQLETLRVRIADSGRTTSSPPLTSWRPTRTTRRGSTRCSGGW
jgi:uncharacterized protein